MSRAVGSTKGAKLRADKTFSLIIRARGACESCGATGEAAYLQCAHIISRRFSGTRCDESNALCLCAKCHHYFTDHPVAFGIWVIDRIGKDGYERLVGRATKVAKMDWAVVAEGLKVRLKEME